MPDNYRGSSRKAAYADYLKSNHWETFKLCKILQEDKLCAACRSDSYVQLHHMRYRATFEESELEDTCWLCRGCHKTFHLRAGVKLKTKLTGEQLKEETVRIILAPRKPHAVGKMSKKERRRIRIAMRREKRVATRARCEANAARNRMEGGKKSKAKKQDDPHAKLNGIVNSISPRSALASSMAGMIVIHHATKKLPQQ